MKTETTSLVQRPPARPEPRNTERRRAGVATVATRLKTVAKGVAK
jgi:hypothetical protein